MPVAAVDESNDKKTTELSTDKSKASLGFGLGLRHCHAEHILSGQSRVDWFEAISENYIDSGGKSLHILRQVAERYPIVLHGVSMSIGSSDPLDFNYLRKLKVLAAEVQAEWISDHLCWTGVLGLNTHDLLPVPLTEETLHYIAGRINTVQDFLGRQLVLENPSTYLGFTQSTISEPDFLRALVGETACALLLDVNNVYVTSFNANTNPFNYLKSFPFEHVVQMHLAGHEDCGTHLIDTHDRPVCQEVWELFRLAWSRTQGASTSLEWDSHIPSLEQCEAELFKARQFITSSSAHQQTVDKPMAVSGTVSTPISFMLPKVMDNTVGEIA